jgi:hypothetical protein
VVQPPEVILATGIMEAVRACNGYAMQQMHQRVDQKVGAGWQTQRLDLAVAQVGLHRTTTTTMTTNVLAR